MGGPSDVHAVREHAGRVHEPRRLRRRLLEGSAVSATGRGALRLRAGRGERGAVGDAELGGGPFPVGGAVGRAAARR